MIKREATDFLNKLMIEKTFIMLDMLQVQHFIIPKSKYKTKKTNIKRNKHHPQISKSNIAGKSK